MREFVRLRKTSVVAVATAAMAAVAVVLAGPAAADPSTQYVTVGSDTIQDVMNQFATDTGNGVIGSWDAVNPVSGVAGENITPKAGCNMTRPNGSGQGLAALRKSINPNTTAAQLANPPSPGCIDFSRSSSGPGTNASTNGALQYIPFALDGVAVATGGTTNIAQADNFTLGTQATPGTLISLYRDCANVTVNGVTYSPSTPVPAGDVGINLYVPQPGSGTRSFWASTLGFNATTLPACVHDHSVVNATSVEEHDGTVLSTDPNGVGPFSIAQWIAQSNGHNDRRHGAVVHNLTPAASGGTAVAPIVSGTLNTNFPITREVYNIVAVNKITSGATGFDKRLTNLLVGANSQLCSDVFTITGFGFAPLSAPSTPDNCGALNPNLRAFDPATNPV